MPQVTLREILAANQDPNRVVGAFNIHNLEFIRGVVQAAESEKTPVIMMINEAVLKYGRIDCLGVAALSAAKRGSADCGYGGSRHRPCVPERVPGRGMDVMYDGSALPFEQNAAQTRKWSVMPRTRSLCRRRDRCAGILEDGDDGVEQHLTTVREAVAFYEQTSVDVLAISVGNVHGLYHGEANINVERIEEIHAALGKVPVVMHGGSDIPIETIRRSVRAGIRKFNIATDLKIAYAQTMRELMHASPLPIQPLQLFPVVAKAVEEQARHKIRIFNGRMKDETGVCCFHLRNKVRSYRIQRREHP